MAIAKTKTKKVRILPFDFMASWLFFILPLLVLIFFLPFGLSLEFSKQIFIIVFTFLGFGVFLLARLQDQVLVVPGYPIILALFGVLISSLISALVSVSKLPALFGLGGEVTTTVMLIFAILATFLTSFYFKDKTRMFWFILALFFGFFLVVITELVRLGMGWNLVWLGLSYDSAAFVALVAILALAALELWPLKASRWWWFVLGTLICSLSYLALANLVPLWFIIAFVSLLLLIYQLLNSPSLACGVLRPAFFVLIISLLFLPLLSARANLLGTSLSRLADLIGWSRSIENFHPLSAISSVYPKSFFGAGPNTFSQTWLTQAPAMINRARTGQLIFPWGFGSWFRAAFETGWFGVVTWATWLGVLLFYSAKFLNHLFSDHLNGGNKKLPGFFLIFLGAAYLWCLNLFYVPGIVLTFLTFVFTGLVIVEASGLGFIPSWRYEAKNGRRTIFVIVAALLLIGSVLGSYFFLQRLVARYHFSRAVILSREPGQTAAVINHLNHALDLEENDLYLRGVSEWGSLRLNELLATANQSPEALRQEISTVINTAVSSGRRALAIRPSVENWAILGRLYENLIPLGVTGAATEAILAYRAARALSPYDPNLWQAESRLAEASGDLASSVDLAREAARLAPNDFTFLFRFGALSYRVNDYVVARENLERALLLNPVYADARYFLGLTYDQLGLRDAAIDQFTKIQETNPDNTEVAKILVNLRNNKPALTGN